MDGQRKVNCKFIWGCSEIHQIRFVNLLNKTLWQSYQNLSPESTFMLESYVVY